MVAVRVGVALTRNLGDFNNLKISGEVEDEVPLSDGARSEDIRMHFKRLYDLVSEEVDVAMSAAIKELKQ